MKNFFRKSIFVVSLAMPLISNAELCSVGTIKGLAEGYEGSDSTKILLAQTEGTNVVLLNYNGVTAAKFSALSKQLLGAFHSGTAVRIYSSSGDCNNINEVRVCLNRNDCM
jgi:hypothetical protein